MNHKNQHKDQTKQQQLSKLLKEATISDLRGPDKWRNLFAPVDCSSLVFFRILFGLLMVYEVVRYIEHDWIRRYWIAPKYHFTNWPFDFLTPLSGDGMYFLFYFMGILAVFIVFGLFYRASMFFFWMCFSYMFLLDQTLYLNHFYLVVLISFVMIFVPANRSASLDKRLFKKIHTEVAPAWSLWLLRFMIGIPYFFGGIAKINSEWLQAEPLKMWIQHNRSISSFSHIFQNDLVIYFMVYSGMMLDLLIVPALLYKKTRKWGFLLIVLFHLLNSQLFEIGIFPWFMIAATSLFFDPDWFRKLINYVNRNCWSLKTINFSGKTENSSAKQKIILTALSIWVCAQVIIPLRHFFIPGSVHWTEEGHRYSWHMMLLSKQAKDVYTAIDKKTGQFFLINPKEYLTSRQARKISARPYLIWQFCQIIKHDFQNRGIDVAVYANVKASLNGRKYQQLTDSTVDMTNAPRPIMPVKWILPLTTSLNDRLDNDLESNPEDSSE